MSMLPLERCIGGTPDCPHVDCPDGWHYGIDLPCSCTPDCALGLEEDEAAELAAAFDQHDAGISVLAFALLAFLVVAIALAAVFWFAVRFIRPVAS